MWLVRSFGTNKQIYKHTVTHKDFEQVKVICRIAPLMLLGFTSCGRMCNYLQEGRGYWAVYYTSPESFIITFSYLMA